MDWKFKGQTIHVMNNGRFSIEWSNDVKYHGTDEEFNTIDEAKQAIDQSLTLKAKNLSMNHAVLRPDGVSATLTGISRTDSYVIMKSGDHPKSNKDFNEAYPDLPFIKVILDEIIQREKELKELKGSLADLTIDFRMGFGRIAADQYPDYIATLNNRVAKAYEAAQEMSQS